MIEGEAMSMLTICLDFDGVIHSYESGWKGIDEVADDVVPGFFEWADEAAQHFRLVVYSARSCEERGIAAMVRWMAEQREKWRAAGGASPKEAEFEFAREKPKAFLYVDDRAHCFDGDWSKLSPEAIEAFKPWNKRSKGDGSGPDRGFEVEMQEGAIGLEVKRFYVPAVLRTKCPKCGADHERDFADRYLSYPVANEPFDEDLYCPEEGCGHEWTARLRLVLRLEGA